MESTSASRRFRVSIGSAQLGTVDEGSRSVSAELWQRWRFWDSAANPMLGACKTHLTAAV